MTAVVRRAKVFVDIGAHVGETLEEVRDLRWGFDHIASFEPSELCRASLQGHAAADQRVELHEVALWNCDESMELYDAGEVGGSLFEGKAGGYGPLEVVEAVDTARYLADVLPHVADLYVKINVEGAELEILEGVRDLVSNPGYNLRLVALLVHVDADKIAGHEQRARAVREHLAELATATQAANHGFFGPTVSAKTRNWLRWQHGGALPRGWMDKVERPLFNLRLRLWNQRQADSATAHA